MTTATTEPRQSQEQRLDALGELIQDQINQSFIEEYKAKATKPEGMGLLIAKYFEWNGLDILKATYNALEDSNFHTINVEIEAIINRLENK